PEQVFGFVKEIKEKFPGKYDFHGHNDYGLAVLNTVKAILAGIDGVHTTVNGLGERTGNTSLIETAVVLKDHYNINLKLNESKFYEISLIVEEFSGKRISQNKPFIGGDVFTQTAGIHADGDKKGNLYKTRLTPKRFGRNSSINYALGKNVGKASIELNLKKLGIELSKEQIKELRNEVSTIGQNKGIITQADLLFLVADLFDQPEMVPVKLLDCEAVINLNGKRTGYVKFEYKGEILEEKGVGDGEYDACMNAT
ncbi:unnamed protein product, partial [marine sediment metagenome]